MHIEIKNENGTGLVEGHHLLDAFCYSPVLNVEKLAGNQNDFVGSAHRGCWLGVDGAIFQAAIRVMASGLPVRGSG